MNESTEYLKPHPLSEKLYGKVKLDAELRDSIKQFGILEPIIATADNVVISGHRRLWHASILAIRSVPIVRFPSSDELEIEAAVIHANKQREKTAEQRAREYRELKRIESAKAKARQATGKGEDGSGGRGKKKDENLTKNSTEGLSDTGEAAAKAAAEVGMSRPTAEMAAKVVDAIDALAAEGKQEEAEHLTETLNNTSVAKAHREATGKTPTAKRPQTPKPELDTHFLDDAEASQFMELKRIWADCGQYVKAAFREWIDA